MVEVKWMVTAYMLSNNGWQSVPKLINLPLTIKMHFALWIDGSLTGWMIRNVNWLCTAASEN